MKLIDLEPSWIEHDGRRIAIIFRCPCCLGDKTRWWLTCFFEAAGTLPKYLADDLKGDDMVIGCNPVAAWSRSSDDFASMTITPSIDASAAGHWHGHVTSGVIA
jgi:hypothetical protein